jgi:hypothetical protein
MILGIIAEKLLECGVEQLRKSTEFKNTKKAIRASVYRELRLNLELLEEVQKGTGDAELKKSIAEELEFSASNRLEESVLPWSLFFDGKPPIIKTSDKNIKNWTKNLKSEADWIERTYHRLRILRARWRSGQVRKKESEEYVRWLLKSLKTSFLSEAKAE